ncbi:hypothetical protein KVR01_007205 [Diaporthe batatas]|uniref:uncharacterized protein n=1 Tax=Diaporthe batatas TaxID=748121 RepID=UPI001D041702|nr:uncharacterized protein KVR01_007205 [Diaporthe batatas]KAG8162727.1 hypothetical protein KVR01_007205 [Diaporthe batatas]
MDLSMMIENASILFANIVICVLYLLPHFIIYSVLSAHISLPLLRPFYRCLQELGRALRCPYLAARWGVSVHAGETTAGQPTGACRSGAVHRTSGASDAAKNRLNSMGASSDHRPKGPRKRGRDDDEKAPPSKNAKLDSDQSGLQFACPFYLHDCYEWHNCLRNYKLHRIVDVRLHVMRIHTLPPQCPSCGEEFEGDQPESADDRCNAHIQLRSCQPLPDPPPPRQGVTGDQIVAIRSIATNRSGRRGDPQDSARAKWFEIWRIIFPDSTPPTSPYITDHPDVQWIIDMNRFILTGDRWREIIASARESSPSLLNMSRNTFAAILDSLSAHYRRINGGSYRLTPAVSAATVTNTPVTAPAVNSSQPGPDQAAPPSANRQSAQAADGFLLPPEYDQPAAAAGPSQRLLQPTNASPSPGGQPDNNSFTQGSPSMPHFDSGPQSLTDAMVQELIESLPESLPDSEDFLETSQYVSMSQISNNYGQNTSSFWGDFNADAADEGR